MNPVSRKQQKRYYQLLELLSYLAILFAALHMGQVENENFINRLLDAFTHMQEAPFQIFPINVKDLFTTALLGLLIPLLIHTQYLQHRDLKPGQESGSAHWNEDLKKYNQKYAEVNIAWPNAFNKVLPLVWIRKLIQKIDSILVKVPIFNAFYKTFTSFLEKCFGVLDESPGGKNMIFSDKVFMSMNTRKTRRNNNIMVIGGSGSGKSRFVVKPNLLQANCSFVITDPSGELLETMGVYLENMGYEIRVFNLVEMKHSNCYNPFAYIRNEEGVLTMITALIKNTTPKGSSSNDPFWEKAETALLQALCFFLVSECNPEDRNFSNVMKLLRCAEVREGQEDFDSTLDILFNDLKEKDPEHIAVRQYAVFKQAAGKTAQSILVSCSVRLTVFNMTSITTLTSQDNIDLTSIGDKKVALFCITPVVDTTFNFLVALMYTQLFETLYFHAETQCKGKRLPIHVRFMLDEFANIGTIPEFSQKLATMRKYEISCTIIIQALSQIKAMYEKDWEVLIGNCDSLLFLGGSDQTTLKYISERLGKETIRSQNNSRSYGKQGSYSLSFNKTGRELLTADEIAVMDNNNCILFIRGQYPFFTTKYNYPRHPNYHMTGDANDKNQFNPKTIITGKLMRKVNENAEKAKMIERQARQADIRQAERERMLHSRAVQKTGMDGTALHEPMPTKAFVEKVVETSSPCELAKSVIMAGEESTLDARQLESLKQYCSEEELRDAYLYRSSRRISQHTVEREESRSADRKTLVSNDSDDEKGQRDHVQHSFTATELDIADVPVFYPSDVEDDSYLDTYHEIHFDDDFQEDWDLSRNFHQKEASPIYQANVEKETNYNGNLAEDSIARTTDGYYSSIEEDESELGELMQKAMESVTLSNGEEHQNEYN